MITLHLVFTILIVNNPLNQKAEEVFKVPHGKSLLLKPFTQYHHLAFGWKRVIVRTGMMCVILFVAETVPTFGPLLDLIGNFNQAPIQIIQLHNFEGGSVLMMTSLVFPCLFYLFINAAEIKANQQKQLQYEPKMNAIKYPVTFYDGNVDERATWRE